MTAAALVCVREDAAAAERLSAALERFGVAVCRSATVYEDFKGYAAVLVILSPGAARSELVMRTAERARDWGKLVPAFVNFCRLPEALAGVPMHDLSHLAPDQDAAEDEVVRAVALHVHRLAGRSPPEIAPMRRERLSALPAAGGALHPSDSLAASAPLAPVAAARPVLGLSAIDAEIEDPPQFFRSRSESRRATLSPSVIEIVADEPPVPRGKSNAFWLAGGAALVATAAAAATVAVLGAMGPAARTSATAEAEKPRTYATAELAAPASIEPQIREPDRAPQ